MRIGIMAAGAIGGYVGARLAHAGHDVVFFARGAHLAAMRANGLKVESPLGDLLVNPVTATDDPSTVAPVDIVLFAVKLWDTERAGAQIKPVVNANTRVITLQNGVDSVERLAPILGADNVVGGSALLSSVIKAPGVILHSGKFAQLKAGRLDGKPDAKLAAFVAEAKAAGLDISMSETMQRDRWQKFVFLAAFSGITSLTRGTIGEVFADEDTREMFHDLLREVVAVGQACGVDLSADYAEVQFAYAATMAPGLRASMAHDVLRGNRLELDWLAGHVVELGRKFGVKTPANAAVYTGLKLLRAGKPA
jgi:2-dehydropantoate 2-reductase